MDLKSEPGKTIEAKPDRKVEKERQRAEKAKKLADKQLKQQAAAAAAASKGPKTTSQTTTLPKFVDSTPEGSKKVLGSLDSPHHKAYIPAVVESAWDSWWMNQGFFEPQFTQHGDNMPAGSFVITIPPPNVTGALHCGHALGTALQDLLIRWQRMRGFTTLYLPGCDHASISTQTVVEKMLWKKEKRTRHDLGRDKFVQKALEWKNDMSEAVIEAVVRLYDDGLIYRSDRLVNWCVHLNTTISNIEVESKDLPGRTLLEVPGYDRKVEFGVMTYFRYQVYQSEKTLEIGTTRLETMLGDTAVAVHPGDPRYKELVGKLIQHPFLDRLIPIIADTVANPDFGSGAVKITPAHDANDFAVGTRHRLPFINILNDDGTMNHNAGRFEGLKRYDVRYILQEELTKLGLFVKKEPNPMSIRLCIKSKDIIEPVMKPQWWMKMKDLATPAIEAVRSGAINIRPESSRKEYFRWLENINDWCLSRQLWWGHQIPAYFIHFAGEAQGTGESRERWVVARTEAEAREKAQNMFPGRDISLTRDPDVLDTWFSSGLWPFATLGWPKKTHDLEKLFPTSFLESGWDILFHWIARMIMLSLKLTGQVPFKEVYCHSLIRDAQGRKMSKSLGNVIDPIAVMEGTSLEALQQSLQMGNLDEKELELASKNQKDMFPHGIPECGADALRFSLINYTTGGGDINFDVKVMAGYRRFCNKIYQATKYVLGKIPDDYSPPAKLARTGAETLPERWIIHRLNSSALAIHVALKDREFSRSSQIIYQYWYDDLCDVFVENSKSIFHDGSEEARRSTIDTLYAALGGGLTMLHPFMPFLSEELWQRLPRRRGDTTPSIVIARYPEYEEKLQDPRAASQYELLIACSKGIRSLMAEYAIKQGGTAYVSCSTAADLELIKAEARHIEALSGKGLSSLSVLGESDKLPAGCAVFPVSSAITVYLDVGTQADVSALIEKTQAKLTKLTDLADRQRKLMTTEGWADKFGLEHRAISPA
ncbi:hypothetical protein LA080_000658 [Diaporthe eres]|nr:hypothetical protein LA080_000658 [Diaporthe eres]